MYASANLGTHRRLRRSWEPYALALLLVTALAGSGPAQSPAKPTRLWSAGPFSTNPPTVPVSLTPKEALLSGPPLALIQTGSSFAATRSIVFSGDRIVFAADRGTRQTGNGAPVSVMELISLDAKTGAIKNTRELLDFGAPKILATDDAHIIVSGTRVLRLTPDLQDAGAFDYKALGHKHGHIQNISPDGSTLGLSTGPGFDLVNAQTFAPTRLTEAAVRDESVSSKGVLSEDIVWSEYPANHAFVNYTDASGEHPLYHGKCGSRPVFLTEDRLLEQGCKDAIILNTAGQVLVTVKLNVPWTFAGVSQNGQRFALQLVRPGTLLSQRKERLVIYSTETGKSIAQVSAGEPPLQQSWSAFSPDGSLFVVGSPLKLILYRLP